MEEVLLAAALKAGDDALHLRLVARMRRGGYGEPPYLVSGGNLNVPIKHSLRALRPNSR